MVSGKSETKAAISAKVRKFEDLEVWKRGARLSAEIYKQLRDLKDFTFKDQITRSGLSIPSNIAEKDMRGNQKRKA